MTRSRLTRSLLPILVTVVLLCLASACTVGPDYVLPTPETPTPDFWQARVAAELDHPEAPLENWWSAFNDPDLLSLIDSALDSNLDLRTAATRIHEARLQLGIAASTYDPNLVFDANYTRNQPSDNSLTPPPAGGFDDAGFFEVGVGVSWEIDVVGRARRTVESATALAEASVEDYRDVKVILMADVAATYVDLRTTQLRLVYARQNVRSQEDTIELTKNRFDAGLTSLRDVAQAESNLANTRALIPPLQIARHSAANRLAVLLGKPPGAVEHLLANDSSLPAPDETIALGVPADLLRRRPDIRRVERQLAAQTALIGVATAELYPSFSLTGALALEATKADDLLDSGSFTWSLVPGLRLNLFNGGRIRNQIQIEEVRTERALLAYEKSVLIALEQVENNLVALEREKVRRHRLEEAVDATQRALELVRTQYLSGLTDFQSLLDAERSLLTQQDSLARSRGQVLQNLIALNRALGGGWPAESDPGDPLEPVLDADDVQQEKTNEQD